mmetsp:Transcript_82690/g.165286  ORF Transcript_82690/g.165286 Transcript_82690/m.165286 type:complete len:383 (+) Transcript_82690:387-1535(+)
MLCELCAEAVRRRGLHRARGGDCVHRGFRAGIPLGADHRRLGVLGPALVQRAARRRGGEAAGQRARAGGRRKPCGRRPGPRRLPRAFGHGLPGGRVVSDGGASPHGESMRGGACPLGAVRTGSGFLESNGSGLCKRRLRAPPRFEHRPGAFVGSQPLHSLYGHHRAARPRARVRGGDGHGNGLWENVPRDERRGAEEDPAAGVDGPARPEALGDQLLRDRRHRAGRAAAGLELARHVHHRRVLGCGRHPRGPAHLRHRHARVWGDAHGQEERGGEEAARGRGTWVRDHSVRGQDWHPDLQRDDRHPPPLPQPRPQRLCFQPRQRQRQQRQRRQLQWQWRQRRRQQQPRCRKWSRKWRWWRWRRCGRSAFLCVRDPVGGRVHH